MHPEDLSTLHTENSDVLCAILNRKKMKIFWYNIRPSIDIPKGHIGMGLLQRASSDVLTGESVNVKVFNLLKTMESMRMNTANFAITSLAKNGTENTFHDDDMIAHIKKTYNMHMFHLNDKFAVRFNNLMYLVQVVDFTTDGACVFRNMYGQLCEKTVVTLSSTVVTTATTTAEPKPCLRPEVVDDKGRLQLWLRRSSRLSKLPRVNYKD
jgi:hypothetical protein